MHAIIRQGNGKYYISAVFGYYEDLTATDEYERYLESIYKPYWIVWDPEKKKLIRWNARVQNTDRIIPQILIIDAEHNNWNVDENENGCVDFLSREILDSILDKEKQPDSILEKCREMDKNYVHEEIIEIKNKQDIENLEWVSGEFHDAYIAEEKLQDDGTLYLLFDGTWGCKIEVWFSGDLEYDTSSVDPEKYAPYWAGSTVILQDDFIYLVDDENMTVDKICDGYCYFKARHMKYRVIPD